MPASSGPGTPGTLALGLVLIGEAYEHGMTSDRGSRQPHIPACLRIVACRRALTRPPGMFMLAAFRKGVNEMSYGQFSAAIRPTRAWVGGMFLVIRSVLAVLALLGILGIVAVAPSSAVAPETGGTVIVHVTGDGKPVVGAVIGSGAVRALSGKDGAASLTLPLGSQTVSISMIGFTPDTLLMTVIAGRTEVSAELKESVIEMSEVVVAATRSERRIAEEPTRVEVTGREDIEEQLAASPGNVAELLTEAGGVRVQKSSAALGSVGVRIRGLSGRYTKILSDGLPLFGLTTEGLAPLQIPPVDLRRVEVIKGVASALYGPTALGGVINLVSEPPSAQQVVLVNQTSRDGTDAVLWTGRQVDTRRGYTLLANGDRQSKQDVDGDGWADIPAYRRLAVRPRLFWTGPQGDSWFLTGAVMAENREGGLVGQARLPDGRSFREDLDTRRADAGSVVRFCLNSGGLLALRGSFTNEWRTHWFGSVRERDRRSTRFAEASLTIPRASQVIVSGAAMEEDAYHALDVPQMDYDYVTPGVFVEHLWFPAPWFNLSSSARLDFHSKYGDYLSPRLSALFHPRRTWSARLSAGAGVFAPTPFTEETDVIGLSRVPRVPKLDVERARSGAIDLDGTVGPVEVNAAAHVSTIDHPVALRSLSPSRMFVEVVNASEPTRQGGAEVFARYKIGRASATASYAFLRGTELDVEQAVRRDVPLNPRHAGGLTVVWEEEDDTRLGLELYYTGRQAIADDPYRSVSRPYVFLDALIQQRLGRVVVFLHGENLNDVRQTRFDPLLRQTPGIGGRWTTDVWGPLEGRVINLGCKLML
jgi:outer membrane receptor for ferrienterochelin and colicins